MRNTKKLNLLLHTPKVLKLDSEANFLIRNRKSIVAANAILYPWF